MGNYDQQKYFQDIFPKIRVRFECWESKNDKDEII
jgi:hypothetical protein